MSARHYETTAGMHYPGEGPPDPEPPVAKGPPSIDDRAPDWVLVSTAAVAFPSYTAGDTPIRLYWTWERR